MSVVIKIFSEAILLVIFESPSDFQLAIVTEPFGLLLFAVQETGRGSQAPGVLIELLPIDSG
jgi:hypothetical protein